MKGHDSGAAGASLFRFIASRHCESGAAVIEEGRRGSSMRHSTDTLTAASSLLRTRQGTDSERARNKSLRLRSIDSDSVAQIGLELELGLELGMTWLSSLEAARRAARTLLGAASNERGRGEPLRSTSNMTALSAPVSTISPSSTAACTPDSRARDTSAKITSGEAWRGVVRTRR